MIWLLIHIVEIFLWLLLAASGAYILFFALVSLENLLLHVRIWNINSFFYILLITKTESLSHLYAKLWDNTIHTTNST